MTLPHVGISGQSLINGLVWYPQNPIYNMNNPVNGANILLHDGRIYPAGGNGHPLIVRIEMEPDSIGCERGRC